MAQGRPQATHDQRRAGLPRKGGQKDKVGGTPSFLHSDGEVQGGAPGQGQSDGHGTPLSSYSSEQHRGVVVDMLCLRLLRCPLAPLVPIPRPLLDPLLVQVPLTIINLVVSYNLMVLLGVLR